MYEPLIRFIVLTSEEVNLLDAAHWLGVRLGIGDFAGGILCSVILLLIAMFPTLILARKDPMWPAIFVGFSVLGFCVAIQWMPYWILLIVGMITALMFSGGVRNWITGRSGN